MSRERRETEWCLCVTGGWLHPDDETKARDSARHWWLHCPTIQCLKRWWLGMKTKAERCGERGEDLEGPSCQVKLGLMHISTEASTNREMRCNGTRAETNLVGTVVSASV